MKYRSIHFVVGLAALLLPLRCLAGGTTEPSVPDHPLSLDHGLDSYKLVWHDEFTGDSLDTDAWEYRTDSKMWSTQVPDNVTVSDGMLHIALKKEPASGKQYTGGGVISKRAFEFGYYEAKFRVPPGAGWHTSFWTMQHDHHGDTKPAKTQEIDICEQDSVDLRSYSAGVIAWGNSAKSFGRKRVWPKPMEGNLSTDFHVWGCEFTPDAVRFYFDGKLTHQTPADHFAQGPQQIWLTSIASSLDKTRAVDDSKLPASADFNYVRFYESASEAAAEPDPK